MRHLIFGLACLFLTTTVALAHEKSHQHQQVPTLDKTQTTVTIEEDKVTITFGPIDLPAGHEGDLAASMPRHFFNMPELRYMTGYKAEVFTMEDGPMPKEYLHHLLLLDMDEPSISCPGEPLFMAGAGMEMTDTRFPSGNGVRLDPSHKLMTLVAFYHKVPPTKNVYARFTMYLAPKGAKMAPLEVYQVGVNVVCFSKFDQRPSNQSDEGISIQPGVQVNTAPLRFLVDGCVKYAYPHSHNGALLVALENRTSNKTLLRTVPKVTQDGTLIEFPLHQVYSDAQGFSVNTKEDYEMVLVHHTPLQQKTEAWGMGNYLLYMTRGECQTLAKNTAP